MPLVEPVTKVLPASSSIIWTYKKRLDLNTLILGFSLVPMIFARIFACLRSRFLVFKIFLFFISHKVPDLRPNPRLNRFLTLLDFDYLLFVPNPLTFIRFGLFEVAEAGSKFPHQLLAYAGDGYHIFFDTGRNALMYGHFYGMRKSQREHQLFSLQVNLKADSFDNQLFNELFINALYHIAYV